MLPEDTTRRCRRCGTNHPAEVFAPRPDGKPGYVCPDCRASGRQKGNRPCPNPSGLCRCGCGQPTPPAKQTAGERNLVAGCPMHFIKGHEKQVAWRALARDGLKRCWHCKRELPIAEFGPTRYTGSGLRNICLPCESKKTKRLTEPDRQAGRELIAKARAKGCAHCGKRDGILHFHHVDRTTKVERIALMVARGIPIRKVEEELLKCIVLCVPCHNAVHKAERSKLSDAQVDAIRQARQAGARGIDLAHAYGVSQACISQIVNNHRRTPT